MNCIHNLGGGGRKHPVELESANAKIKRLKRCLILVVCVSILLISNTPAMAEVSDNLDSAVQRILGTLTDTTTEEDYQSATLSAKLNYLYGEIDALEASVESLQGMSAAYNLYCYLPSSASDIRYDGVELTLTSSSGNQRSRAILHLDETLNKYVTTLYCNFSGSCTLSYGLVTENVTIDATGQEHELKPFVSDLTVWIDDTNSAYSGKSVTLKKTDGSVVQEAELELKNGHYEATMTAYTNGNYRIAYPFISSNGTVLNLSTSVTLNGTPKTQELFGDLQDMTLADIQTCCKAGSIESVASVGDTFSDGTYTYTIIGINQDKPCNSSGTLLSAGSYGDVLTVMCLGADAKAGTGSPVTMNAAKTPWGTATARMNSSATNSGSWAATEMRSTTMASYLAKLPANTRNVIGFVQKTTGTCNGFSTGGTNSTSADKCFLLSEKELLGRSFSTSNEADANTQYQYFKDIATTAASRNIYNSYWWLRSPDYGNGSAFCVVNSGSAYNTGASNNCGVYPAFCIY